MLWLWLYKLIRPMIDSKLTWQNGSKFTDPKQKKG